MLSDLGPIIADVASRADDFLAEGGDRAQARTGIAELITTDYPSLEPAERAAVAQGVIQVLEEEGRFGIEFVGDPFSDAEESPDD